MSGNLHWVSPLAFYNTVITIDKSNNNNCITQLEKVNSTSTIMANKTLRIIMNTLASVKAQQFITDK